jgi:hypothetical protein
MANATMQCAGVAAASAVVGVCTHGIVGACVCAYLGICMVLAYRRAEAGIAHAKAGFAASAQCLAKWRYDTCDTAEQAARALYAVLRDMCVENGRDPDDEVVLRSPDDNARNGTGHRYWYVSHEEHPYPFWAENLAAAKVRGRWGHVRNVDDFDVIFVDGHFGQTARYLADWHYDTYDTAEQAARGLYAVLRTLCAAVGGDPDRQVLLLSPQENARQGGQPYWYAEYHSPDYPYWGDELEARRVCGRWGHVQTVDTDSDVMFVDDQPQGDATQDRSRNRSVVDRSVDRSEHALVSDEGPVVVIVER